jgi:hypothetical protein
MPSIAILRFSSKRGDFEVLTIPLDGHGSKFNASWNSIISKEIQHLFGRARAADVDIAYLVAEPSIAHATTYQPSSMALLSETVKDFDNSGRECGQPAQKIGWARLTDQVCFFGRA